MRQHLFILLLAIPFYANSQAVGDYRTATASATWSSASHWQVRGSNAQWSTASAAPGAGSNVFIQTGHTVTLTADAACNNLNIDNSGANHLALGTFTLSVHGALRSFIQSAPAATGAADGTLYTGGSGNPPTATNWITSTSGKISIVGGSRTLTASSQWSATNAGASNPNGFDLEVNLNTGATVTCNTSIKARTITINSGTLDMQGNRLSADLGNISGSNIKINSAGNLASAQTGTANQVASRISNSRLDSFFLASGGTLILVGTSPAIDANVVVLNGTVVYNKAGNQSLLQKGIDAGSVHVPAYTNLVLDGSGIKTPAVALTVDGTLFRQGTATLAALPGISYGPASTLEYSGSAAQTTGAEFSSSSPPFNLRVNNANNVTLSGVHTIAGNLGLSQGQLVISGANALIVADNATTSGGSASSYVSGPLTKIGNDAFSFPVGGGSRYRPVAISAPGNSADAFTARYFSSPHSTTAVNSTSGLDHVSYAEYWDIARTTGTATVDVTLNWGAGSGVDGSQLSSLRLAHFNGTNWDNLGVNSVTSTSLTQTNVSSFSPFTLGSVSTAQALGVKLVDFIARSAGRVVAIHWKIDCEKGIRNYVLQRTAGSEFATIGEVLAANDGCDTPASHSFVDSAAVRGHSLYRLTMNDQGGSPAFSKTVSVYHNPEVGILLYPTVAQSGIYISGLKGRVYTITDITGRRLIDRIAVSDPERIDIASLLSGMYYLRSVGCSTQRFVKQ